MDIGADTTASLQHRHLLLEIAHCPQESQQHGSSLRRGRKGGCRGLTILCCNCWATFAPLRLAKDSTKRRRASLSGCARRPPLEQMLSTSLSSSEPSAAAVAGTAATEEKMGAGGGPGTL